MVSALAVVASIVAHRLLFVALVGSAAALATREEPVVEATARVAMLVLVTVVRVVRQVVMMVAMMHVGLGVPVVHWRHWIAAHRPVRRVVPHFSLVVPTWTPTQIGLTLVIVVEGHRAMAGGFFPHGPGPAWVETLIAPHLRASAASPLVIVIQVRWVREVVPPAAAAVEVI
mgnify:CR=1 FL=1